MSRKAKGIILIIELLVVFASCYFILNKNNKYTEIYGRVIESFGSNALVEQLVDGKGNSKIISVDIPNLNKGDVVKITTKGINEKDLMSNVIKYEVVADESTNEEASTSITTTTLMPTTTKTVTPTTSKTILKKNTPLEKEIDDQVTKIDLESDSPSFKENAKEYFIRLVDFIFYDKDINGVYFKDLTNKAKLKVISLTLKLDGIIEKYYPNYKDEISDSYKGAKAKLVALYLDNTSTYCENHDDVCKQAKSDFAEMKKSLNITWDIIKSITDAGVSKLKKWYEIYSGK